MHRPKIGSVLIAAALAMATMIPLLASPAGAVVIAQCSSGQYPNRFGAESKLTVDCTAPAGATSNNIGLHDADNAVWHHGAARTVALTCAVVPCSTGGADVTTKASTTIKWTALAAGTASIAPAAMDVGRPISAFTAVPTACPITVTTDCEVFKGGTYIVSVTGNTAVISQAAVITDAAVALKIEHTTNRVLVNATCTGGTATITEPVAPAGQHFQPSDLGKSVSGR